MPKPEDVIPNNSVTINTKLFDAVIEHEVAHEPMTKDKSVMIINLLEEHTINALRELGWSTPEETKALKDKIAKLESRDGSE